MSNSVQSCIKEFNKYFTIYQRQRTEDIEHLLHRDLSILCGSATESGNIVSLEDINLDSMDVCQFFINLYNLMENYIKQDNVCKNMDVFWSCILVLQQSCQNLRTREGIIYRFRFIPILTKILHNTLGQDKIKRLLEFLKILTYGIRITWEEPYLAQFIQYLGNIISSDEEDLGILALEILINICYKNDCCLFLLLKIYPAPVLAKRLKPFGYLAHQMLIILDNNFDVTGISDLTHFIKKSFIEMESCLQSWNVPYLEHICKFLLNSKDHEGLHTAFKEFKDFEEIICSLLSCIESRLEMDDCQESDTQRKQAQCFSIVFEMFNYIFRTVENKQTLQSSSYRIFELANSWSLSSNCDVAVQSLRLMQAILETSDENTLSQIENKIDAVVGGLLVHCGKTETPKEEITEILNLFITLLHITKMQKYVLSNVTESYFDKVFSSLLSLNIEELYCKKTSDDFIANYLLTFLMLIEFHKITSSVWIDKISELFEKKQILLILAKGFVSDKEYLCKASLEISKLELFPQERIAKVIKQLLPTVNNVEHFCTIETPKEMKYFMREIPGSMKNVIMEERLNKIINQINDKLSRSDFDNLEAHELIELFNYRIDLQNATEKNLLERLEAANRELTNFSHRLNLQSTELTKCYNINVKLRLGKEKTESDYKSLVKEANTLKNVAQEQARKLDVGKTRLQDITKLYNKKQVEVEYLRKETEILKEQEEENVSLIKQLENTVKESNVRLEKLREKSTYLQESLNEKDKLLQDKDKEISKFTKSYEDLKLSNSKSQNLIVQLEAQLAEKNKRIDNLEEELLDSEEMRKTVLSLMESKKPKRKA